MVKDKISNLIIGLKNASLAKKDTFVIEHSILTENILKVLKRENLIQDYKIKEVKKGIKEITIIIKFDETNSPVINDVKRVSKLSKRIYKNNKEINPVRKGYGLAILTTPLGILTDSEAREKKVGGEVLFEIW